MTVATDRRLPDGVPHPRPRPLPRPRGSARSEAPDDGAELRVVVRHALAGLADPTRVPAAALDHRLEHHLRSALEAHPADDGGGSAPNLADVVREACLCLHTGRFAGARQALHVAEDLLSVSSGHRGWR